MQIDASDETLRHFDSALGATSSEFQVTFVVEGVPLRQSLGDDDFGELKKVMKGTRSESKVIAAVANAYDYDCEKSKSNIYLLKKRYTDANDLPCITFDEIVRSLQSIFALIEPGTPTRFVMGKDSVFWKLYDSLSADQKARGPGGLSIEDFTLDQRKLALECAREGLIRRRTLMLWLVLHQLQMLRDQRVVFAWIKFIGGEALGYEGPFRPNGMIQQLPLNNGFKFNSGGSYTRSVIRKKLPPPAQDHASPVFRRDIPGAATMDAPDQVLDETVPTDLDRFLAPGMLSGRLPGTRTLAELAASYKPVAGKTGSATVDIAVGEKPVTLYGTGFSSSEQILRASASIYDLRILDDELGRLRIALPRPGVLERRQDAGPEIIRLMPAPFMRYWTAQTTRIESQSRINPNLSDVSAIRGATADPQSNIYEAEFSWYYPAVRRLLVLALPAVPTPAAPPVPVASVGPEALRLIALLMLSGEAADELNHLRTYSLPECLEHPESMIMKIQMNVQRGMGGQQLVLFDTGYRDGSGHYVQDGGFGTTRNPPQDAGPQPTAATTP